MNEKVHKEATIFYILMLKMTYHFCYILLVTLTKHDTRRRLDRCDSQESEFIGGHLKDWLSEDAVYGLGNFLVKLFMLCLSRIG